MTITDLKSFATAINAKMEPTDKMAVTLTRRATTYVMAYLHDRRRSIKQSMADPKISDSKRAKRQFELDMVEEQSQHSKKQKFRPHDTTSRLFVQNFRASRIDRGALSF